MSLVRRLGASGLSLADHLTRRYTAAGARSPFELVLLAEARLARARAIRQRAYPRELRLLDRFLSDLGITNPAERERAYRERTMASWLRDSRRFYATLSPHRQRVWLPLAGDIEATLRNGAFLLATHFGGALVTSLALSRLKIPMFMIVRSSEGALAHPRNLEICDLRTASPHQAILTAHARLRRGEVVLIAGDVPAPTTNDSIGVNVLGRTRIISRAFAELSLASSVSPTPIFSRVDASGQVYTWMERPLVASGSERTARLASLAQSYARVISTLFARHPGNVPPPYLKTYFESPLHDGEEVLGLEGGAAPNSRVAAIAER